MLSAFEIFIMQSRTNYHSLDEIDACDISARKHFDFNRYYLILSAEGRRGIVLRITARESQGRRSLLIVLIYFPLSPVSTFLNCAPNSFDSNATRRIKMLENFSHSF